MQLSTMLNMMVCTSVPNCSCMAGLMYWTKNASIYIKMMLTMSVDSHRVTNDTGSVMVVMTRLMIVRTNRNSHHMRKSTML